jgi:hypothetical protein
MLSKAGAQKLELEWHLNGESSHFEREVRATLADAVRSRHSKT